MTAGQLKRILKRIDDGVEIRFTACSSAGRSMLFDSEGVPIGIEVSLGGRAALDPDPGSECSIRCSGLEILTYDKETNE